MAFQTSSGSDHPTATNPPPPNSTSGNPNDDNNNNNNNNNGGFGNLNSGSSIPFSFLIAFIALFLFFLGCGLGTRRVVFAFRRGLGLPVEEVEMRRRKRGIAAMTRPVLWDVWPKIIEGEGCTKWGALHPLSATYVRVKPPDTPPTRTQPSPHVRPSSPPPRQTSPPIDAGFLPSRVGRMSRTPSAAIRYNSPPPRPSRNHERPSASSSLSPIPASMASSPAMGMESATVTRSRNPSNLPQQEGRSGGSDGGAVDMDTATARNTTTVTANATAPPNAMETPSPLPPVSFFERVREAIVSHPYTTAILMRDFNDPNNRGHPRSGDQENESGPGDKPRPPIEGLQVALLISMPSQERSFTRRMKAKLDVDSYQHIEGEEGESEKGGKGKRIDRGSSFESRGSMEGEEYEGVLGEFVVGTTSVPWGKEVG